jgi:16S rRNA (guanine527-N7)-methyltransferase
MMELLNKYFPGLDALSLQRFAQLQPLYQEWNERINVISRKDIDALYERHVLHALAIARVITFAPGARVLDLGTGGGIPGIPLAIFFPETSFLLVDSIGKKVKVVQEIATTLGLDNVQTRHARAEELKERVDFVVTRGVAPLDKLLFWSRPLLKKKHLHAIPNGLLALKGGDISEELALLHPAEYTEIYQVKAFFEEPFFDEKLVVYVQG